MTSQELQTNQEARKVPNSPALYIKIYTLKSYKNFTKFSAIETLSSTGFELMRCLKYFVVPVPDKYLTSFSVPLGALDNSSAGAKKAF